MPRIKFLIVSYDCRKLWELLHNEVPGVLLGDVAEEYTPHIGDKPKAMITRDQSGFHHPVGILSVQSNCRDEAEKALEELRVSGKIAFYAELYEDKD